MLKPSPSVTIVVPVYNRLHYLAATLDSVLGQTYQAWELIVVDDGSQEDVAGLLALIHDARIQVVRQCNQGNAAARNTGIQASTSDYVICLDSDDVWHPRMLETCASVLRAHPTVDVVFTQFQSIDADGHALPISIRPEPLQGSLLQPLLMGYPILPSSAMVRRTCFDRWGLYTPGMDDWELWLRWAKHGCCFACIAEPLLYYRIHDQNFNLDWTRRRNLHFAMLDHFYAQSDLPPTALVLRDKVYTNQHVYFIVLAWQVGRPEDAMEQFCLAVQSDPATLHDLDFYTRIACAHQNRQDYTTSRNLNLVLAQEIVTRSLDWLFGRPDLPKALHHQQQAAYGWAYLALARLAYGGVRDMAAARRFLLVAFSHCPSLAWRSDWALWLARSLAGYETIQRLKGLPLSESGHAKN